MTRTTRQKDYVYLDKISKGCSRCPEKRPRCLDYHHLYPSTKVETVSRMASESWPMQKLIEEMDKCVLLCSNCHRVEELGDGYRAVAPEDPLKGLIYVDKQELAAWVDSILNMP